MFDRIRSFETDCAQGVYYEVNGGGSPFRICFWSFLQCVATVLLFPADVWGSISYRILCWRIATGRIKQIDNDDDIPF